jgi:hypothetical protein
MRDAAAAGGGASPLLVRTLAALAVCTVLVQQGLLAAAGGRPLERWVAEGWAALGAPAGGAAAAELGAPIFVSGGGGGGGGSSDGGGGGAPPPLAQGPELELDGELGSSAELAADLEALVAQLNQLEAAGADDAAGGGSNNNRSLARANSSTPAAAADGGDDGSDGDGSGGGSLYDPAASMREVLDIIENSVQFPAEVPSDEAGDDDDARQRGGDGDGGGPPAAAAAAGAKRPAASRRPKPVGVRLSPSATPQPSVPGTVREARALWRLRYPLPPWMATHTCSKRRRYLHLLTAHGGMGSWVHIVHEALALAKATGRFLVEPCVRAGALVPCWPDRVASLPASPAEASPGVFNVSHDVDPLAVPAFAEACDATTPQARRTAALARRAGKPPPLWMQPPLGRAYPLRLYLDLAHLARAHPRIVSYEQWLRCARKQRWVRNGRRPAGVDTLVSPKSGRVFADRVYCVGDRGGPGKARMRGLCKRLIGPYRFDEAWSPPREASVRVPPGPGREPLTGHMMRHYRGVLAGDTRRNVYLSELWRGSLLPAGHFARVPVFNDIHRLAVRAWLRHTAAAVAGGGYRPQPHVSRRAAGGSGMLPPLPPAAHATFHWVADGVSEWKLGNCAASLARRTAAMSGWGDWVGGGGGGALPPPAARLARAAGAAVAAGAGAGAGAGGAPPPPPPPRSASGTPAGSPLPPPPHHPATVLVADTPGPRNPCSAWGGGGGDDPAQPASTSVARMPLASPERRGALAALLAGGGLVKYDDDHPAVDGGVLAIRDYLLARDAATYVTCAGGGGGSAGGGGGAGGWTDAECRACTRADSPYVESILAVRRARGRHSITSWFTGQGGSERAAGPAVRERAR